MADDAKTPGLSKKTKAQLIDIILRKDDTHKKLNVTISDMQKHLKVIIDDRDVIAKENEQLKSDNEGLRSANLKVNEDNIALRTDNKNLMSEVEDKTKLSEELKEEVDNLTSSNIEYKNAIKLERYCTFITGIISIVLGFVIGYVF